MAVTGTGTEDYPYIVNTYNEIVTYSQKAYPVYLRLDNDIDCNDYGDSWEWTTIELSRKTTSQFWCCYLDMYGHTIKNIMLKSDNILFDNYNGNSGRWKIYSSKKDGNGKVIPGKILNVFNNSGNRIFSTGDLENISISINGTGLKSYAFVNCKINQCSIYYKSSKLNNHIIFVDDSSSYIKNSHLWFDVLDVSGFFLIGTNIDNYTFLSDCKIEGKVKGQTYNTYSRNYLFNKAGGETGIIINSVMSLDTKDITITKSSSITPSFRMCPTFTNTVVNTTMSSNLYSGVSCIRCIDSEIKNADSLNSKGFNVVEVGR